MAHQMELSVQQELRKLPGNNKCVDCDAPYPQWATVSYGTFMCLECSGRHRGLGVHISFVRSVSMDSWTDKQIRLMQLGGNDHFRSEFERAGVPKTLSIAQKYNTPQAEAFRNRLNALVEGSTPVPLPRWDPSSAPSASNASGQGDAKGVEALKGESEQDYVARQNRLKEEARARMAAKFGAGGMQGIGSSGASNSSSSSSNVGYSDVTSSLGSAFSLLSTTVSSAATSAASLVNNPELTNTVSSGWSSVQAKLTDPELTNTVKSTATSSWSYLTSTTSSLLKNAQAFVDPNTSTSNDNGLFPRTNPSLPETSKYEGVSATGTYSKPTSSFSTPSTLNKPATYSPEPIGQSLTSSISAPPAPIPSAPKKEVKKDVDFFERRKENGVVKMKKLNKKKDLNTSIDALIVHKIKLTPKEELNLFYSNKNALEKSNEKFTRAIYSIISQYHQSYIDWYPYDPKSYERQGYSEYQLKNYTKSIERLSQAVYLGSNSSKLWRTLGRACFIVWKDTHDWGLLWDSKSCYENALKYIQVSTSPYALLEYIYVLEGLGEFNNALGITRTILYSFPSFLNLDRVVLRATILMFHSIIFQKSNKNNIKIIQEMLEQCCDYCKFIIDKDVTKTDMYITLLYVTARIHEVTALPRTIKYAATTYEELYRVGLRLGIIIPIAGMGWMEWSKTYSTWKIWVEYFDKRDEIILAVDAAQEGLKRVQKREWNDKTFSWEPETTMWYTLGMLYYKCNDMIPAVAAMETSLYFGRYRPDVRDTLLQWYPQQWSAPMGTQAASQIKISVLLRGVWGRDKAKKQKEIVIQNALTTYSNAPYTSLHARKILMKYLSEKYAPIFAAQSIAARTIQILGRCFVKRMRAYYAIELNRANRLRLLVTRLHQTPYERLLREELAHLSVEHRTHFERQTSSTVSIQRVFRGYHMRKIYHKLLVEKQKQQAEESRITEAACRIQRRFRHIRSNALLHTRHILRMKKERLAVNLQRLYRRKKSLMMRFLRDEKKRRHDEVIRILRRQKCVQIQTWYRRCRLAWKMDAPVNEATFLLERLLRGHDALMKDEQDLDFYARRIQALYRDRKDRICLQGIKRIRMPSVRSIVIKMIRDATTKGCASIVTNECISQVALRNLLASSQTTILQLQTPQHIWPNLIAAFAQGCGAQVDTFIVAHGSHIKGEGLSVLIDAIRSNQLKRLRVLAIGANEIVADVPGCMPWRDMSTCLQTSHFQLRELVIEDNDMNDTGAMHLANVIGDYFFGRYGHLSRLVLARVNLGDLTCIALATALSINTILKTLELHGNRITDEGAITLAGSIGAPCVIEVLELSDNNIGSRGARSLFHAMENSKLKYLGLMNNNIKNDIMGLMREVVKRKNSFECIDLRGNLLHADNLNEIQSWFEPETTNEIIPKNNFETLKINYLKPNKIKKQKNIFTKLRQEKRQIPFGGYKTSPTQLLKLPALARR